MLFLDQDVTVMKVRISHLSLYFLKIDWIIGIYPRMKFVPDYFHPASSNFKYPGQAPFMQG